MNRILFLQNNYHTGSKVVGCFYPLTFFLRFLFSIYEVTYYMKSKKDKVKIITLGCSKNLVDSEFIMAQLSSNDIEIVEDENDCNTVIINTCGFIESAKQESVDTILKAVENKKKGKIRNVFTNDLVIILEGDWYG